MPSSKQNVVTQPVVAQPTIQEEPSTMLDQNVVDQPVAQQNEVDQPVVNEAPKYTVYDVLAYDSAKVDAAVTSIRAKHALISQQAALGIPVDLIAQTRATLGITESEEVDVDNARASLSGELGTLVAALGRGERWDEIVEFSQLTTLVTLLNSVRAKVGIKTQLNVGASGNASQRADTDKSASNSGYLAIGTYNSEYKGHKAIIVATKTQIKALVDGLEVWSFPQGYKTISAMINQHILPASGAGASRIGAPDFFETKVVPHVSAKVMLPKPPTDADTREAIATLYPLGAAESTTQSTQTA